jgi:hypothetical protein
VRPSRLAILLVVLALAFGAAAYLLLRPKPLPSTLTIDYMKIDGRLGSWTISMRPPLPGETRSEYVRDRVLYASVQEVAGPPAEVDAVRFPPGTHVLSTRVAGSTATVDLSREVDGGMGGSFSENGEFEALVFTLTDIPGINSVQVLVDGQRVETLPGGHLELDAPLRRSDFS